MFVSAAAVWILISGKCYFNESRGNALVLVQSANGDLGASDGPEANEVTSDTIDRPNLPGFTQMDPRRPSFHLTTSQGSSPAPFQTSQQHPDSFRQKPKRI